MNVGYVQHNKIKIFLNLAHVLLSFIILDIYIFQKVIFWKYNVVETLFRVYLMNLHVPCSTLSLSSYLSILLPRLSKPSIYTVHSIK